MEGSTHAPFYVASMFSPLLYRGAFSLCCCHLGVASMCSPLLFRGAFSLRCYYLGAAPTLSSAFVTWLLAICCCHVGGVFVSSMLSPSIVFPNWWYVLQ